MVDWGEVIQYVLCFTIIIAFGAFLWWVIPDPNSKEEQMEMCMLSNDNNTKLCKLEVKYGEWIRFSY